jgi:putative PIN family toxin of toxin-antitoxin system
LFSRSGSPLRAVSPTPLTHRSPVATLIDHHLARDDFVLVTAPELLAELDRVLGNSKLQRCYTEQDRTRFVALVMSLSEVVDLPISPEGETTIPRICRDPDDDRVIACAVIGEAGVIVSGDDDLLDLEWVGGIPILTAARFLEMLEQGN